MSSQPTTHRTSAARRPSTAIDASSSTNSSTPQKNANGKSLKGLQQQQQQQQQQPANHVGYFLNTLDSPEVRPRRSRTPRGAARRSSAEVPSTEPLRASRSPLYNSRLSRTSSTNPAKTMSNTFTTPAASSPYASASRKSSSSLPQEREPPRTRHSAPSAAKATPSRSAAATVSAIRPRTSVGTYQSDVARSSGQYTPTLSTTAAAANLRSTYDVAHSSVQSIPFSVSPSSPTMSAAPVNREGTSTSVRALVTPRTSFQNVDDMSQLVPVVATKKQAPRGSWGAGGSCSSSGGSSRPIPNNGKAPTALHPDYVRSRSGGTTQVGHNSTTFSHTNTGGPTAHAESAAEAAPTRASRRQDEANLLITQRPLATAKELRRRAASAGPTSRHAPVPTLSLQNLHEPFQRGGTPTLISRGPPQGIPAVATSAPAAVVETASEQPVGRSSDFLSSAILAINEVRAMDSDVSSANAAATTTTTPAGRTWLQRGASTPRAYSPRPETATSLSASPVNRALRGKTEVVSGATTPRLSASTPRFTVATNVNSLPYTARASREGTPVTGSLTPAAAMAAGAAATYPAAGAETAYAAAPHLTTLTATAPPTSAGGAGGMVRATDMNADVQDYVAAVAEQVARHYYVVLTAADIGRGAALQADPPQSLCLRSMLVDLNTVASLLSYDNRNPIQDLLFDDCAFPKTMDLTWMARLTQLTALRFKGRRMTTALMNRLLALAATVQTVSFISTARITSLASLTGPSSRVRTLQIIQTDFSAAAYAHVVNCPTVQLVMLLQVQLRTNIFDLLNTNHLRELHLVGCPDIYYEGLPETEWVSACSPRLEALTLPTSEAEEQQRQQQEPQPTTPEKKVRTMDSVLGLTNRKRKPSKTRLIERPRPPPVFPLRALVIADCPGLRLSTVPFADFRQLEEVSIMYQRGVRAADLAGVLAQGKLSTLRLQEVFVDDHLIQQLRQCTSLHELNLSFCRGMRGIEALWPALADSLRVLNVSYSEIDDGGFTGLCECRMLCNVYARGCTRLRSCGPLRQLSASVGVLDLTDCAGIENDAFSEPLDCTGVHRLLLAGCSKVRTVSSITSLRMLEELSLARTGIDDTSFAALARDPDAVVLQTLTSLDLSGCRHINHLADFAGTSATALRNVAVLRLAQSSITNAGVAHVARAVVGGGGCLTELDLSGCTGVSQLGPLGAVKTLHSVNASFSGVDDAGLAAFVQTSVSSFNRELRVLNLNGCTGLRDVSCLGQLPRLAVLGLSGTTVDGTASFVGLAKCVGLQELDISECPQVCSVVSLVPQLTKLRLLNLSLTNIADDSVEALAALTDLEVLQLSGCRRVEQVTALGSLSLLQRLNLSATHVTDLRPLLQCPQLWDLSVCACPALTTLRPLARASTLQRLDAADTPITDDSFATEWMCASLEELDVHGCAELHHVAPGALRKLVSLRRVNASHSSLGDTAVAALAECENLCEVQLNHCPVTSLSLLGVVPTLQSIEARSTNVNDEGIAGLEASESLTTLDLSGCRDLHDVSALHAMRCLTTLLLSESGVTDASFAASWNHSGLRELDVSACRDIREPAMVYTLRGLEALRAAGSGLTNDGLRLIAQCPALRRLNVAECEQLTDLSPLSTLDSLTHLDASQTPIVSLSATPASVEGQATGRPASWLETSRLRHVKLRSCHALADVSALRRLPQLFTADFTGSAVAADSFEESWATCASLETVYLTDCTDLEHVRGLWAAPHLMQVHLDRSSVERLDGAEQCTSLEVLDASQCKLLRNVAAVRSLPRLQQLQCCETEVTDDAFAEPWTAPNLYEVNFTGCEQMRDVSALGSLPRLRSATFADTYITDVGVRELSKAPLLEDLDFRGCSRLAHLGSLSRMPHIRALYLSNTCIDNFTFTSLSRCKKLEVLEMENCPYVTNVFVVFEFGQLRYLKFPPLSRMVGSVLHSCCNLEYLSLHECPISFEIESLSALPRLRVLDVRESAIKSGVLAALHECPCLEEVDVSYCSELTSLDAMGDLPRLRCFSAAGLPVTDDVCDKLAHYPLLEKVVLAECHLLHDVSALGALPQLHHLDISESGATEASFVGIRHMRALEELSVHGCSAIRSCRLLCEAPPTEDDAATVAAGNETEVKGKMSSGLREAEVCLPRLRLIDLCGTGVSASSSLAADVVALRRQCPLLTKIYLDGEASASSMPSVMANVWKKIVGS